MTINHDAGADDAQDRYERSSDRRQSIKMNKKYDQTAHYMPTQATPWAVAALDGDSGADHAQDELERNHDRRQSAKMNQLHAPGGALHAHPTRNRDQFGFDTGFAGIDVTTEGGAKLKAR
jgi:hypothetical protein